MSDEEEYDEEDDGDEDEDGEGKDNDDADGEERLKVDKKVALEEDIGMLKNIFTYVDNTSARIAQQLSMKAKLKSAEQCVASLQEQLEKMETQSTQSIGRHYHELDDDNRLSYSQYEDLDEGQRAELLEQAIHVLAGDPDGGRGGRQRRQLSPPQGRRKDERDARRHDFK